MGRYIILKYIFSPFCCCCCSTLSFFLANHHLSRPNAHNASIRQLHQRKMMMLYANVPGHGTAQPHHCVCDARVRVLAILLLHVSNILLFSLSMFCCVCVSIRLSTAYKRRSQEYKKSRRGAATADGWMDGREEKG
jgi:hypothetical protein